MQRTEISTEIPPVNLKKTQTESGSILLAALKFSSPVFLGYQAIGIAFGLLLVEAGYPFWLAPLMGIFMYAGAGQFISVGLFAAGAGLAEALLVQIIVNARHIAYGLSMLKRFRSLPAYRFYLIYALTDETFALLSSLETPAENAKAAEGSPPEEGALRKRQGRFMLLTALLDQFYWVGGSLIGALAGTLIPFNFEGIAFALSALFIVLMIEQILRVRKPGIFIVSAAAAVLAVFLLPGRVSLLGAMALAFCMIQMINAIFSKGAVSSKGQRGGEE
jgi:4-azaleucine resistance transporter AzlC